MDKIHVDDFRPSSMQEFDDSNVDEDDTSVNRQQQTDARQEDSKSSRERDLGRRHFPDDNLKNGEVSTVLSNLSDGYPTNM